MMVYLYHGLESSFCMRNTGYLVGYSPQQTLPGGTVADNVSSSLFLSEVRQVRRPVAVWLRYSYCLACDVQGPTLLPKYGHSMVKGRMLAPRSARRNTRGLGVTTHTFYYLMHFDASAIDWVCASHRCRRLIGMEKRRVDVKMENIV